MSAKQCNTMPKPFPFPNDPLSRWAADMWLESQEGVECWRDEKDSLPNQDYEWMRNRLRSAFRAGSAYGAARAQSEEPDDK